MAEQGDPPRTPVAGGGAPSTRKNAGPSVFTLPFHYNVNKELTTSSKWYQHLMGTEEPSSSAGRKAGLAPKFTGGFAAVCMPERTPKRYASFHNPEDGIDYSTQLFDWWMEIAWKDTMCLASSLEIMEQQMIAKMGAPGSMGKKAATMPSGESLPGGDGEDDDGQESEGDQPHDADEFEVDFSCKLVTFDVYGKSALFVMFRDKPETEGGTGALHFLLLHVSASKAAKLMQALGSWIHHDFHQLIGQFLRRQFVDPSTLTTSASPSPTGGAPVPAEGYGEFPEAEHLGNGLLKILFRLEKYVHQNAIDPRLYMNHPNRWLELMDAARLRRHPKLKLLLYDIVTLALSRYHVVLADQEYFGDSVLEREYEMNGWLGLLSLFFPLHRIQTGTGLGTSQLQSLDRPFHLGGPTPGLSLQRCTYGAKETPDQLLRCPEMKRLVETAPANLAGCCIFLHDAIEAAKNASTPSTSTSGGNRPRADGGGGGASPTPWRQHMKVTSGHVSRTDKKWESLSNSSFQPHPLVIESIDFVIAQVNEGLGTLEWTGSAREGQQFTAGGGDGAFRTSGDGAYFQHNILVEKRSSGGLDSSSDSPTRGSSGVHQKETTQAASVWRLLPPNEQKVRQKILMLHFLQWRKSLVETCARQWSRLRNNSVNEFLNVVGIVATTLQIPKKDIERITAATIEDAIAI